MATLRRWRTSLLARTLICFVAASMAWLQVGPAYGLSVSARRVAAQREAWRLAHLPHVALPPGLTQTPDASLQKKINAKQAALAKPVADVRPLSAQEMGRARGRGAYRNPYFAGAPMPWQRSFRDVNLCDGNLFKSFTDVQVAPARGAGLVLQRTYNSNEARVGPFGVGWTHAYDIRIQEAADVRTQSGNPSVDNNTDDVPRTDFFGHKHTYHRDADGLYSPPAYMYDEMNSDYNKALVNGPIQVMDDTETGMDGTVKHYISVVTKTDGTVGNERACDSIQDRHGNKTTLTYGLSYVQPDSSTRKLLTQVTDPSGRSLVFHWTNLGTTGQPAYRITQVDAPTDPATGSPVYRVLYSYYTDSSEPNAANDLYNLKSVTLDPDGLSRTTTYTYTSCGPTNGSGSATGPAETGLLASISDPLRHTVSYQYMFNHPNWGNGTSQTPTNTIWVDQVTEPSGTGPHTWTGFVGGSITDAFISSLGGGVPNYNYGFGASPDALLRVAEIDTGDGHNDPLYQYTYDTQNNIVDVHQDLDGADCLPSMTYGPHGNVLRQGFRYSDQGGNTLYSKGTTNTYYNADKYFQKSGMTDARGLTTAMDYYDNQDASLGNRGEVQWVRDAGYSDPASPSYGKQFTYTYNQYGQKTSETNLRGVVTQYTYGDQWGNLTQVVQDPGGTGHLNRMTTMQYDVMGRVLQSTDPSSQTSTFAYNSLGQPKTVSTPAKGSTPAETISYIYDGNGRTHSVQDNRGTTTIAYQNGTDLVQSVTDPMTGTTGYTYGSWGERLTMTLPGGGTWTYVYATMSYNDPSHDGSIPSGEGNVFYSFPDPSNIDSIHRTCNKIVDDQGRQVTFGYTDAGVLIAANSDQVFDSSGYRVGCFQSVYEQDQINSGHRPTNNGVPLWTPSAELLSLTTTWYQTPNSSAFPTYSRILSQNAYTYDDDLNRKTNTVSVQPANPNGSGQTDANGNPVLASRTESYAYDSLNRLSAVNYGDGQTQGYGFDPMGNRLQKQDSVSGTTASTFDAANRLLTVAQNGGGASAITSDANGNTLTDASGRSMTWDSQNRMASCTKAGVTSTYTYGADGLRRSSTVSGVTTYYVYDGQTMIREMKKNPTTGALFNTATYFQGPRGGEYRRDDTQTELDSQGRQVSVCRWYVYDGLGSVVGEVDPSGNLTSSPKYDVYGAVRANPGTASTRQGFVGGLGHVSDTETGLVYMRARYYDPSNGRFVSEDPAKSGMDWFVYCDNNPVNMVDNNGKTVEHATEEAIKFFAVWLITYASVLVATGYAGVGAGMAVIRYGETISALGDVVSGISPQAGGALALYGAGIQIGGGATAIGGAAQFGLGLTLLGVAWFCLLDSDDVSSADVEYYSSLMSKS